VPIIVYMNKTDPGFDTKLQLINETKPFMKFRVVENLEERVMSEFLSWVRYVEFDGDLATLYLAKNEAINEYTKKRQANQ